MKTFVLFVIIGVGAYFGFSYSKVLNDDNNIYLAREATSRGKLSEAASLYEKVIVSPERETSESARLELVEVYKRLGDSPELSTKECAEYYQKAFGLNPDCLTQKQAALLEGHRRFKHGL